MTQPILRTEHASDRASVFAVHRAAFETDAEARLVDTLRASASPTLSLVAEAGGSVEGHIFFSPVTHAEHPELRLMGLGPMAVQPRTQRKGLGSLLVRRGLETLREQGLDAAVVLGHPEYYPRFGFEPASRWGVRSVYEVPDEAFMALELRPGSLSGKAGLVTYHPAFSEV
ncbi:MAG: N-acetyltransferase [Acidobacteriota bacterium]